MTHASQDQELFRKQCIINWDELLDYYQSICVDDKQWVFRGQTNADWVLETTLERLAKRFSINLSELSGDEGIESGLIRRFQRQASLYISSRPDEKDLMQWLAFMQHYGTPTRLLDWTYSFFVSVYFAFETVKPGSRCAVWAIDRLWLRDMTIKSLPEEVRYQIYEIDQDKNLKKPKTVKSLLNHSPPLSVVCQLNPFRLNERLVLQQGVFLAPGDVSKSFMDNLHFLYSSEASRDHFVKLILDADLSFTKEAISQLHRMNINRATLFPGLDGFATSLGNLVLTPVTIAT